VKPLLRVTLTLALAALIPASTSGQAAEFPGDGSGTSLDHFLCYRSGRSTGEPRFPPIPDLALADGIEEGLYQVKRPLTLCIPADKDGEGIVDPVTHLRGYRIDAMPGEPGHVRQTDIRVLNPFGGARLDTIRPGRLLIPTAKDLSVPVDPPDPGTHDVDHFKCYRVRSPQGFGQIPGIWVEDQLNQPKHYNLRKPKQLCLAVDKNGEGIKNPDAHLLCYQAKPASGEPRHARVRGIHVNGQLGPERLDTIKVQELCVPSTVSLIPSCGDGVIDAGEECDDGLGNSDTLPDACRSGCTTPRCGDDVRDSDEACDGLDDAACPGDCLSPGSAGACQCRPESCTQVSPPPGSCGPASGCPQGYTCVNGECQGGSCVIKADCSLGGQCVHSGPSPQGVCICRGCDGRDCLLGCRVGGITMLPGCLCETLDDCPPQDDVCFLSVCS
jgi:hypothetical protein